MSENTSTPPWGSDEEFDPNKAWNLIQNLRAEVKEAKTGAESLVAERDQFRTQVEELQATVKLTDDTAKQYESELGKAQFGRQFDRLAYERGIPLNVASTVNAVDEEDAIAKLDALAEWRGKQDAAQVRQPDPAQVAEPVADEQEALARQFFGINN